MMSIWSVCQGEGYIKELNLSPWRVVEAQHVSSSRDLVDTLEEHELLELLLEESKPFINKNAHYLLFSPFRYPPLKYGSRFATIYEPSLWYGSLDLMTAFAEVAYYRFLFLRDSSAELDFIETPLTAFNANIKTNNGIDLTELPFLKHQKKITHKASYEYSQPLGSAMRKAGVEVFIYQSARSSLNGKNIAAFTPDVFYKKNNKEINIQQSWRCVGNKEILEFMRFEILTKKKVFSFAKNAFS